MLTVRPDRIIAPTALEFQNAGDVDQDLQDVIEKQSWPLSDYSQLMKKLDEAGKLCGDDDIDVFPRELLQLCRHVKHNPVSSDEIEAKVGTYLWRTIASEYQREGVSFLLERGGRGLLADEPGLGKTLQAILFMLYYRNKWPVVIVCPSLPKLTWQLELKQWLLIPFFPGCRPAASRLIGEYLGLVNTLVTSKQIPKRKRPITIVSYDLLRNPDVFKYVQNKIKPQILIVDECHYMKHEKAKRTRVVTDLAASCKHVLLMSGTPLSRCQDLFAQLHCLYPKFFPNFFYKSYKHYQETKRKYESMPHRKPFYFAEYFCAGTFRQQRLPHGVKIWVPQTGGISRQALLHQVLSSHILIQRTQKAVLSDDLPEIERIRYMMPNPEGQDKYKKANEQAKKHAENQVQLRYQLFEQYNELAKIKGKIAPIFLDFYLSLHDGKPPKTLVWAHHHEVMAAAQTFCEERKIGFIRIDGTVPYAERIKLVELFKTDQRITFAILSLTACNTSLNLQVAKENVFLQLLWDVFQMLQAECRNHRRGQTSRVISRFALAENSLDKLLWKLNQAAYRNATAVTQGAEDRFLAEYKKFLQDPNQMDDDDDEHTV